jgi:glycosyltransferase involved in cell wall biosynthesis
MVKIVWLTAGCYLQVDLPFLNILSQRFDVEWIVAANKDTYIVQHANEYAEQNHIKLHIFDMRRRWFHPQSFKESANLMKFVSQINGDVYYLDYTTFPHLFWSMRRSMKGKKLLLAMHHGKAHSGMRFTRLHNVYLQWLKYQPYYFLFFSHSQSALFETDSRKKFVIPLAINDYGQSEVSPPSDKTVFQYFGHMISTKNVGLLITAACKLKEQTDKPFVVRMYGHCRNWEQLYQPLIKYPEIFDIKHESIPDDEIPDVFSSAHYLVQPYKTVTQSGPTKLAYGYHLPIIASDLPGFRESIVENITGLFFKSGDVDSLTALMKKCIDEHPLLYIKLRNSQRDYVENNLSVETIINQYEEMFNKIANE